MNKEKYWVSPYNNETHAIRGRKAKFYDTTLRDGEQTLRVSFSAEEKLEIALMLEQAKVDRIEAGIPVMSPEDKQAVQMIVENVRHSQVFGFCRCTSKDIDACLDVGVEAITCELPVSSYK